MIFLNGRSAVSNITRISFVVPAHLSNMDNNEINDTTNNGRSNETSPKQDAVERLQALLQHRVAELVALQREDPEAANRIAQELLEAYSGIMDKLSEAKYSAVSSLMKTIIAKQVNDGVKKELAAKEEAKIQAKINMVNWMLGQQDVAYAFCKEFTMSLKQSVIGDVDELDQTSREEYENIKNLTDFFVFAESPRTAGAVDMNRIFNGCSLNMLKGVSEIVSMYMERIDEEVCGFLSPGSCPVVPAVRLFDGINATQDLPGPMLEYASTKLKEMDDAIVVNKKLSVFNDIRRFRNGQSQLRFGLVHVNGIPTEVADRNAMEDSLVTFFSQKMGEVQSVDLRKRKGGSLKGSARMAFVEPKDAEKAVSIGTFSFPSDPPSTLTVTKWVAATWNPRTD